MLAAGNARSTTQAVDPAPYRVLRKTYRSASTRSETVLASKTTASTPTITPLQENVWTKCYQYETLVQEV